ncbi:hypothetical protein ACGFY9_32335 [Streptomyces sp. NPDC048504]
MRPLPPGVEIDRRGHRLTPHNGALTHRTPDTPKTRAGKAFPVVTP